MPALAAALAWALAAFVADRVDQLAVLSVGHPVTFLRTFEQRQKSWYMLLFQFPGVAERWLTGVQMTDSAQHVTGPWRYERLDGPGHWMQLEAPGQVNTLLLDFLAR